MTYRFRNSYNRYHGDGGYDTTGRWRSEAWHMDGGANDEGWHQRYCSVCNKETEHGRQSTGNFCVPCSDRRLTPKVSHKKTMVVNPNPHKLDRWAALKLYEVNAGAIPGFLKSLVEQNEKRCLTPKQVKIGAKILSKIVDQDIIDRLWSRTTLRNEGKEIEVGSIVRLSEAVNPMLVLDDNGRGEILLESLESGSKSWTINDGRWLVIK